MSEQLDRVLHRIDQANKRDPNRIEADGVDWPKEWIHGRWVSDWVQRLRPDASESLLIAARAHHLERWLIPRASHPPGRTGYLRWRKSCQRHHAEAAAKLMDDEGYGDLEIRRVRKLIQKHGLRTDPEVQVFEDALCLVFLERQLRDFASGHEPRKASAVLHKTLDKMTAQGRSIALVAAKLGPVEYELVRLALVERADSERAVLHG